MSSTFELVFTVQKLNTFVNIFGVNEVLGFLNLEFVLKR